MNIAHTAIYQFELAGWANQFQARISPDIWEVRLNCHSGNSGPVLAPNLHVSYMEAVHMNEESDINLQQTFRGAASK